MSKKYLFLYFCTLNMAFGLNLDEILISVEKNSALAKSLKYKKASLEALSQSENSSEPIAMSATSTRANPFYMKQGMEYEIGISKMIKLPQSQNLDENIARLSNEATLIEEEIGIIEFENRVKNLYHQSCIDIKQYNSFQEEVQAFNKLYTKKQKAYKLGDISKLELMQLEMQKSEMRRSLEEKEAKQKTSRELLLNLAYIKDKSSLSCKDLYPLKSKIELGNKVFALTNEANSKRIASNLESITKYTQDIDSIELHSSYTSELEQDKYSIGVSIPLNFTSHKNEYKKVSAMYQNSELELKKEHDIKELMSGLERFYYDLKIEYLKSISIEKNILYYKNQLLPLTQKSYEYGHSSAMEYLMAKEKLYTLENELYETQKRYYEAVFNLYSIAQVRGSR